jgi:hypothetical protein
MVSVDFGTFSLALALEDGKLACTFNHNEIEYPFGENECSALLDASVSFLHFASVPLATVLSLLSHIFRLVKHALNRPVSSGIPVVAGRERTTYRDPVFAICAALLVLIDPGRETGQATLVRFLYSYAPPCALPPDRSALSTLLAEAAVDTYVAAMRNISCFVCDQQEIGGRVTIPRLADSARLRWLSHNPEFLSLLRRMLCTRIFSFRELVSVLHAVYDRALPATETQDLVGAALDVLSGAASCRVDITAATREWLRVTDFPPSVTDRELNGLLRMEDDALLVWACGVRPAPAPAASLRPTSFLAVDRWDTEEVIRVGGGSKRPAEQPLPREPKKQKKLSFRITTDDDDDLLNLL